MSWVLIYGVEISGVRKYVRLSRKAVSAPLHHPAPIFVREISVQDADTFSSVLVDFKIDPARASIFTPRAATMWIDTRMGHIIWKTTTMGEALEFHAVVQVMHA